MQAGLLNEMIAFYRSESKRDNLGGTSESWVKVFDKRAYIRFKSGARKEANGESNIFRGPICKCGAF